MCVCMCVCVCILLVVFNMLTSDTVAAVVVACH